MTVAPYQNTMPATAPSEFARWVTVLEPAAALADRIADTDFVPASMRNNAAMITAAIMYGDELGLGPMQALAGINVIKGKPSPSSELMRALVLRAGHSLRVLKSDGQSCRVVGQRRGEREGTVIEWSLAMAQAAGLVDSNQTWRKYPRAMLLARATSELCRVVFPDVVKGLGHVADDDESTAQGFAEWAREVTGEDEPTTPTKERVTRRGRKVTNTELPAAPVAEPPPRLDDGPHYEPVTGGGQPGGTVQQPPLPDMPPAPDTVPPPVTAQPQTTPPQAVETPLPVPDDISPSTGPIGSGKLLQTIHALFTDLGLGNDDRPMKLAIASAAVERPITSTKLLTRREGLSLVRVLNDLVQGLLTFAILPNGTVEIYPTDNESEPT